MLPHYPPSATRSCGSHTHASTAPECTCSLAIGLKCRNTIADAKAGLKVQVAALKKACARAIRACADDQAKQQLSEQLSEDIAEQYWLLSRHVSQS